jgi:signal transduction histidine kinase
MKKPLSLLLVEDNEDDAILLIDHFRRAGYDTRWRRVQSQADLAVALDEGGWDLILSDYRLPGFSGDSALELVKTRGLDIPFMLISGMVDDETASAAMRAGAKDYLDKDRLDRLVPAVERELREARIRRERHEAIEAAEDRETRISAIASNIPGMVFQLEHTDDGNLKIDYAGDGAAMLFGVPPAALLEDADLLLQMILPADRDSFLDALARGAERMTTLNWEGRIRVPEGDEKWINVRGSPLQLADGMTRWAGVMLNITHSKEWQAELSASRTQLAELSSYLQRIKEEERERIARDIHDVLGGLLIGIKIEVSLLAGKLTADDKLSERAKRIGVMLDDAISTSSRVARELRPGILKEFGLAAAIESQAEDFSQRMNMPCRVLCADYDISSSEDTEVAIFRIFQEALTNVAKHARANSVEVRLMQEGDEIVLQVADDGVGITSVAFSKPRSFGLRGMRERVAGLGGTLEIRSGADQGTELVLRVPLGVAQKNPQDEEARG